MAKFAPQSISSAQEDKDTAQSGENNRERFASSSTSAAYEEASRAGNNNTQGNRDRDSRQNQQRGFQAAQDSMNQFFALANPFNFTPASFASLPMAPLGFNMNMDRLFAFPILMGRAMEDMMENMRSFQIATQDLFLSSLPTSQVSVEEDAYVFRLDLPGYEMSDLKVHASPRALKITGRRQNAQGKGEGKQFSQSMNFERIFPLAQDILSDDAEARFENGTLTVRIPRGGKQRASEFKPLNLRAA